MNTEKSENKQSYLDWALEGRTAWWLYVLGAVLAFIMVQPIKDILSLPLMGVIGSMIAKPLLGDFTASLIGFIFVWVTPPLFVWLVHKRLPWSVALPKWELRGWDLLMGLVFSAFSLLGARTIVVLFGGLKVSIVPRSPEDYFPFLLIALVMFALQTSAEELVFRGYIMQALRRLMPLAWIIIPLAGIIFALPHLPNLAGLGLDSISILLYVIDGMVLAWLALRSGSLWMPFGWHWTNNFLLLTLIGIESQGEGLQGLPLFLVDRLPGLPLLMIAKLVSSLIFVSILTLLISRKNNSPEERADSGG